MDTNVFKKCCFFLILSVLAGMVACSKFEPEMAATDNPVEIRVVTTYSPTTYFIDNDSETGFEYELARLFAEHLKIEFKIIIATNKSEMIDVLLRGEADIAIGLIKQTFSVNKDLLAGPEYYNITQQVIFKRGIEQPKSFDDLYPYQLHIAQGGIRPEKLRYIKRQFQEFSWKLHMEQSSNDLIELIDSEKIAYAAVYSNELLLAQQTYPELSVAFDISQPTPLTWFIRKDDERSLLTEIETFFETIVGNENLVELIEYFYGPVQKFDYVDQHRFLSRYTSRLPLYESTFKDAANTYNLDWRMLAAMSYQESHWNARAQSPTGVRGLMMLTLTTAKQMGIVNRLDPTQSIIGGTQYINQLVNKIPEPVQYPDRMWFALAAYNIGFGHLEDARIITEKQGGDPDKWQDVKNFLPYLQNSQWYKKTLYGYARGSEAVTYVEGIRKYYNTMIQLTHEDPVFDEPIKDPIRMVELNSMAL